MLGPKVLLRALVLCATLGLAPLTMAAETEGDMVLSAPVPAREEARLVLPDIPELEPRPRAIVLQIPDGDTLRLILLKDIGESVIYPIRREELLSAL